jgi:hypothetical protein
MQASGAWCAAKPSCRATSLFFYIYKYHTKCAGANMVLFADTNLLITGKDEFHLQHKTINKCYESIRNMVSKK